MGKMTLLEATNKLGEFDPEHTIYAVEPWSPTSTAIVGAEPQEGTVPADPESRGMSYFLEISVAQDFIEDLEASLPKKPSANERCQRLIDYAINDA
ncbi:hypothetical protein DB347_20330 [Opitutaceae bacterium EW11]|nr:hypothetical protein DB347_20330 [Opitutaceae bacterium EW11]